MFKETPAPHSSVVILLSRGPVYLILLKIPARCFVTYKSRSLSKSWQNMQAVARSCTCLSAMDFCKDDLRAITSVYRIPVRLLTPHVVTFSRFEQNAFPLVSAASKRRCVGGDHSVLLKWLSRKFIPFIPLARNVLGRRNKNSNAVGILSKQYCTLPFMYRRFAKTASLMFRNAMPIGLKVSKRFFNWENVTNYNRNCSILMTRRLFLHLK